MSEAAGSEQGAPVAAGAAAAAADDWKLSVEQSYRNAEVREIAKVLASLEPGATVASKKRLAMQFEDKVFKTAPSLQDYRKTIVKRLNKLKKGYKPSATMTETSQKSQKERAMNELRQQYGDSLLYICQHAAAAIEELKAKHGEEKSHHLKQHTDSVAMWALDLGIYPPGSTINLTLSEENIEKLKGQLERRCEYIRSHIVKLADPDRYYQEALEKTETDCRNNKKASKFIALNTKKRYEQLQKKPLDPLRLLQESLERAGRAVPLPTRNQNSQQNQYEERAALLHLDKMRAASTALLAYMTLEDKPAHSNMTKVALAKSHTVAVEGIAFVKRVMKRYRQDHAEQEQITLEDAWTKPLELNPVSKQQAEDSDLTSTATTTAATNGGGGSPDSKRLKTSAAAATTSPTTTVSMQMNFSPKQVLQMRSKVLLTAGRKTPFNLIPALQRKRARLVRPCGMTGEGSHLILEFGKAFVMTIYFVPLIVTIRAFGSSTDAAASTDKVEPVNVSPSTTSSTTAQPTTTTKTSTSNPAASPGLLKCAHWTPLHYGLVGKNTGGSTQQQQQQPQQQQTASDSRTRIDGSVAERQSKSNQGGTDASGTTTSGTDEDAVTLSVWGCQGPYELLGHVVEERLRDASAAATRVLRQCFTQEVSSASSAYNVGDFELEILEASALLKFLQLARCTYIPDWQDDDV